jgi:hypothetical protein
MEAILSVLQKLYQKDLISELYRRVLNQFTGGIHARIFFLHIPKCGGTSIGHAVAKHFINLDIRNRNVSLGFDLAASLNVANILNRTNESIPGNAVFDFEEKLLLYFMSQNRMRYIAGHFVFSETAYRQFHDKYAFIVFLRNPVTRVISNYFYNKYKEDDWCRVEADITPFLQSERGQLQGHQLVKYIGGISDDYSSTDAIDRAKRNLHKFDIVGILEFKQAFLNRFENRFGVRLKLKKKNPNPKSLSFQSSVITKEIEHKIRTICKPDLELYQYAIDHFVP